MSAKHPTLFSLGFRLLLLLILPLTVHGVVDVSNGSINPLDLLTDCLLVCQIIRDQAIIIAQNFIKCKRRQ